ncbi:MAG TPA: YceI family protein [Candidatus Acidoferrales bacterium]|nr:YceI family protein [Candidatus Acidoferrales bacterium]
MANLAPLRPGSWQIDALHSQVMISVWHFDVAHLRAKFPAVRGGLTVDPEEPLRSRLEVEIDAASVTTGHARQEEFMRSEPWLDTERHPLITFKGTAIEPRGEGILVKGDLTLRGVTRSLDLPVAFHGVVSDPWGLRAGFSSQVVLDRRDFGITWDRVFDWGLMASHELTLMLDIELAYPDPALAQTPQQIG